MQVRKRVTRIVGSAVRRNRMTLAVVAVALLLLWPLAREPVELTDTEYAVLYELAVHVPSTLTHTVLLQQVWGPQQVGKAWLVRNVVKLLRRKLGDDADSPRYIITESGVSYRMAMGETGGIARPERSSHCSVPKRNATGIASP